MSPFLPSNRKFTLGVDVALVLLIVVAVVAVFRPGGEADAVSTSQIASVGIDADTSGNAPRTALGGATAPTACARVDQGQTRTIDVFVNQVPADRGISGFEFDLLYNQSHVRVTAADHNQLLAQASGSNFIVFGETTSSDGSFSAAGVDFGQPLGIEPAGTSEAGPGILVRITLTGQAGVGVSNLQIADLTIADDEGSVVPVQSIVNAQIAANTNCPGGTTTPAPSSPGEPTPTPTPTGEPDPTPTPEPGETTGPGVSPPAGPTITPVGSLTPTPTASPPMQGDANCDSHLTAADSIAILESLAAVGGSQCLDANGDMDCSGDVSSEDALLVLVTVSGVSTAQAACN